jgi:hypothetical protein
VARTNASPRRPSIHIDGYRIRQDKVDKTGKVTLRYRSRLDHIGVGRGRAGQRIVLLTAGREVRILAEDGQLIRRLVINPKRDYQPQE